MGDQQIQNRLGGDVIKITLALIRTAGRNTDSHRALDLTGVLQLQFPAGSLGQAMYRRDLCTTPLLARHNAFTLSSPKAA